ncbi:MAG TPA: DUF4249 family protein [Longimicrobiaceae bacterium]|nr:DUF4249 family protein [Longimicrobiaceae bacterium]
MPPIRPLVSALVLGAATVAAAGCELTEVTTADSRDVLVVEAVLRPDRQVQEVMLHRTLQGAVIPGEAGARVRVRTEDGREIAFSQTGPENCLSGDTRLLRGDDTLRVQASCYRSPAGEAASWVVPGRSYELLVETARGERVRGTTRVPGSFDLRGLRRALRDAATGERRCFLPPRTEVDLTWSASSGAWAYLTEMEVYGLRRVLGGSGIGTIPDPLRLVGVSVSEADTTVVVPSEVGAFDRLSYDQELLRAIQGGFPEDVQVHLVVAAADRNFVNGVRGGQFNPSGTVRISSVVGDGVGVFGSIVPVRLVMDVRGGRTVFPCLD